MRVDMTKTFDHTLDQWLEWQSKINPQDIELGLSRVSAVWSLLNGKLKSKVISIAGTNGKGSSVAMLESILKAAGYTTASYTSPHLIKYNERIKFDSVAVSDELLCSAFEKIEEARGDIKLTYFEYGTLAALFLFMENAPDVVILEVGLGGRLDAVNIIDCDVALITSIGLDHQDWLGDDIETIAKEKAGIMRSESIAIYASEDTPESIKQTASDMDAILLEFNKDFGYSKVENGWNWYFEDHLRASLPFPSLRGEHQLRNACGVLTALDAIKHDFPIDQKAIRDGLTQVSLAGRFEVIPGDVNWILDVAHNAQAASVLFKNLQAYPKSGRCYALLGMLDDKDIDGVVETVTPVIDHWYICGLDVPRGLSKEAWVSRKWLTSKPHASYYENIQEAVNKLKIILFPGDTVIVFGSFYTVSTVQAFLTK